ncbi:hypothetical protein JXM83_05730 [Candidatus Woesearchaeota archaeon]|nr:hypothetical protein [Candidatus Woesearchaeota archaeon]
MSIEKVQWIIARTGGVDGTSLLHQNSIELLNSLGIETQTTTGIVETDLGMSEKDLLRPPTIVSELNFDNPISKKLYSQSFKKANIPSEKWLPEHDYHVQTIESKIEGIISQNSNQPIIIHNLLSLREFHPQAALALRRIISKNPHLTFISYAADSSFERPERVQTIQNYAINTILETSRRTNGLGPYDFDNLYHVVLNETQENIFSNGYNIPRNKIFRLPDFLPFESEVPHLESRIDLNFVDNLSKHCTRITPQGIEFYEGSIDEHTTYFIEPVRPIERKKIKTAIFIAKQYEIYTKKQAAIVITHPNKDEGGIYFNECVQLANNLNISLIYLGEDLRLKGENSLWTTYQKVSELESIALILSSKGGWENAINECVKNCIPAYMNPALPSYNELKRMNISVPGDNLDRANSVTQHMKPEHLHKINLPEVTKILEWIKYATNPITREELVLQNYSNGYQNLSSKSRVETFLTILNQSKNPIYKHN